jgi:hypothetical protein
MFSIVFAPLKFAPAITATPASAKVPDYSTALRADFFTPRLVLTALDHPVFFVVVAPRLRLRHMPACFVRSVLQFL